MEESQRLISMSALALWSFVSATEKDANLSKREFGKSFEAIIEGVCLIATSRGYFLNKAIAGNSGFKYSLITLEAEDLDDGASELEDLI